MAGLSDTREGESVAVRAGEEAGAGWAAEYTKGQKTYGVDRQPSITARSCTDTREERFQEYNEMSYCNRCRSRSPSCGLPPIEVIRPSRAEPPALSLASRRSFLNRACSAAGELAAGPLLVAD